MGDELSGYQSTFICLANSRKISGRCIAGKTLAGAWVRPISSRPTGELSEYDRGFSNGGDPKLLDIVTVQMVEPRPHAFQTENHLIDDKMYWAKAGQATYDQVEQLVDTVHGPLWDDSDSSYNGLRDRVELGKANALTSSLKLIRVTDFQVVVAVEGAEFNNGKRKVRGQFTVAHTPYLLAVTDPNISKAVLAKADGTTVIGEALLCISLGEPYNGYAYKLVAGVILR